MTPLIHLCIAKRAWEMISRKTSIIRTMLEADSPQSDELDFNVLHAMCSGFKGNMPQMAGFSHCSALR